MFGFLPQGLQVVGQVLHARTTKAGTKRWRTPLKYDPAFARGRTYAATRRGGGLRECARRRGERPA